MGEQRAILFNRGRKLVQSALLLVMITSPMAAFAQSTLESTNFKLQNVNLGDNLTLATSQDSQPPVVSSEGPTVTKLSHNSATITWTTDKKSSSVVEYGTAATYGKEAGSSTLVTAHTVEVYGLSPETLYHFRVKSIDALGAEGLSTDYTFTTPSEKGINSIEISDITYTSALISWVTGDSTKEEVQYGTSTSYGQSVAGKSLSFTTNHTVKLEDLKIGTRYHFRIVATSSDGEVIRSSDLTFTTLDTPKFTKISASTVDANKVDIFWDTNTATSGTVSYTKSGETKALTVGTSVRSIKHTTSIEGLIGSSDYTYTITATDEHGDQVTSAVQSFKTPVDTVPPQIKDLKTTVTRSGDESVLTITWKTNEPSKGRATLLPKTGGDVIEIPEQTDLKTEHVLVQTGIKPSTPYTVKAVSTDPFDNKAEQEISFVSPNLRKSVLALILESILRPFGWLAQFFQ